ncbi:MAG: DUF4349 domain-containing protein [Gemmatimonadota bacterium]|nr:DUF4349 domain-containing protein [Gemmatimonadota bacterium]
MSAIRARRRAVLFLLVLLPPLGIAAGCDRAAPEPPNEVVTSDAPPPASMAQAARAIGEVSNGVGASTDALKVHRGDDEQVTLPSQRVTDASIPTMIIRRGDVSIRVDSLDRAIGAIRRLAASLGGYIGDVSMNAGDYEVRRATLVIRVPTARFDEAMAGMSPLGKVEHSNVTAEDVGEEFVDVQARIANGRRLEARLIELLATRTGKLADVLTVERELARVRGEIERHEGRSRFLSARVATSTIAVTVSEPAPVVGTNPERGVVAEAFVNAWRNFLALLARVIESLGVLVPLVLLAWAGWRIVRSRRRRREA